MKSINDFDFDGMTGFVLGYGLAIMVILAIVFLCTIATGVIPNESVPTLMGVLGISVGGWLILLVLAGSLEWAWDTSYNNQEAVWKWASTLSKGFVLATAISFFVLKYSGQWNLSTSLLAIGPPMVLAIVFEFIKRAFAPKEEE